MQLVLVEGLPGSGKTTTARWITGTLRGLGINPRAHLPRPAALIDPPSWPSILLNTRSKTMLALTLSPASPSDAALLTRLIRCGKAHWGYPSQWLKAWEDELMISAEQIQAWHVRTATFQGQLIGFFALAHQDGDWWLEHLWLAVDRIGHGFGRELFCHAIAAAADLGAACVRIEADPNAKGFYLHMGAMRDGGRVSSVTGATRVIPHLVYPLTQQRPFLDLATERR